MLLCLRHAIFGAERVDQLLDLGRYFLLGQLDGGAQPDDLRMPAAPPLRELGILSLQSRHVGLQLLDIAVGLNRREGIERGLVGLDRSQLMVERFHRDRVQRGVGEGSIQIPELLHHDVLALIERDGIVVRAILLERRFARFDLRPLLRQALHQPLRGIPRAE